MLSNMKKIVITLNLILMIVLVGCEPNRVKEYSLGETGVPDGNPKSVEISFESVTMTKSKDGNVPTTGYDFYLLEVSIKSLKNDVVIVEEETNLTFCYFHLEDGSGWEPTTSQKEIQTGINGFDIFEKAIASEIKYIFVFEILEDTMKDTPNKEGKFSVGTNYGSVLFVFVEADIITK